MNPRLVVALSVTIISVALGARPSTSGQAPSAGPKQANPKTAVVRRAASAQPPTSIAPAMSGSALRSFLDEHCVECHNDRVKAGGVALHGTDLADIAANPAPWERSVRKTRAGMMPPAGSPRLDSGTREMFAAGLEAEIDRHAVLQLPAPGLHRLNRSEYANAVRDLLGLEVDATKFLPSDDSTAGFDNMAGTLVMSPALLEAYLSAAGRISRLAVGVAATPTQTVYRVPEDASQDYHI